MRRPLWQLLSLLILSALVGCSGNTVAAGENGIRVNVGEWIGQTTDGKDIVGFTVAIDGANIFVYSYSFPCGERTSYVFPPTAIRAELNDSAFAMTANNSDLSPKYILTGKFIDSTHIEGTWETFTYQNIYLGTTCPAAKGTWTGSPK